MRFTQARNPAGYRCSGCGETDRGAIFYVTDDDLMWDGTMCCADESCRVAALAQFGMKGIAPIDLSPVLEKIAATGGAAT